MRYHRFILITLLLLLAGCSEDKEVAGGRLLAVKPGAYANKLYYSGIIQPAKTVVVPSLVDGTVVEMPIQYGEYVKPGQLLFMISSAKFLADYKAALLQYIKAKSDFNTNQTQLSEAEFLHKNQLISDDDYKLKRSNYYAAQLTLLQAKDALENILHQLDIKGIDPYQLTIADVDKITQAMRLQVSSENNLRILSPAKGIILAASKGEDDTKKVMKGDVVKQGDVLAVIGDMSGLRVKIKVNELTINQLKIGQKVKITGIAFPEYVLDGWIEKVDKQGEAANNGMPTFSAEVVVAKLTPNQQKDIHVGMSAKVEIDTAEDPQIMIPIPAIIEKNGHAFVKLYNEKNKSISEVAVSTGKTTVNEVAILDGLKAGDKIVIPD